MVDKGLSTEQPLRSIRECGERIGWKRVEGLTLRLLVEKYGMPAESANGQGPCWLKSLDPVAKAAVMTAVMHSRRVLVGNNQCPVESRLEASVRKSLDSLNIEIINANAC